MRYWALSIILALLLLLEPILAARVLISSDGSGSSLVRIEIEIPPGSCRARLEIDAEHLGELSLDVSRGLAELRIDEDPPTLYEELRRATYELVAEIEGERLLVYLNLTRGYPNRIWKLSIVPEEIRLGERIFADIMIANSTNVLDIRGVPIPNKGFSLDLPSLEKPSVSILARAELRKMLFPDVILLGSVIGGARGAHLVTREPRIELRTHRPSSLRSFQIETSRLETGAEARGYVRMRDLVLGEIFWLGEKIRASVILEGDPGTPYELILESRGLGYGIRISSKLSKRIEIKNATIDASSPGFFYLRALLRTNSGEQFLARRFIILKPVEIYLNYAVLIAQVTALALYITIMYSLGSREASGHSST